jgi:hypothetical protein
LVDFHLPFAAAPNPLSRSSGVPSFAVDLQIDDMNLTGLLVQPHVVDRARDRRLRRRMHHSHAFEAAPPKIDVGVHVSPYV